jgi:hypothetical protein
MEQYREPRNKAMHFWLIDYFAKMPRAHNEEKMVSFNE